MFYFNSTGTFSKLDTSLTLSKARIFIAVTTISYNGINYAIFGGGRDRSSFDTIDIFYFNSTGTFSKFSTPLTLSETRYWLAATTISYNGIDYAIFAGGYNGNSKVYSSTIDIFYFNNYSL